VWLAASQKWPASQIVQFVASEPENVPAGQGKGAWFGDGQ